MLFGADASTCRNVAARLERDGYHVLIADDEQHGIDLIQCRRPDAVVTCSGVSGCFVPILGQFARSHCPHRPPLILLCGGSSIVSMNAGCTAETLVDAAVDVEHLVRLLADLVAA